jgi:hypothetical protein
MAHRIEMDGGNDRPRHEHSGNVMKKPSFYRTRSHALKSWEWQSFMV